MGSYQFTNFRQDDEVRSAFLCAKVDAAYWHGHGGYTGTIAEKDSWVVIDPDKTYTVAEAEARAEELMANDDERITDKWGPAGALKVVDPEHGNGWYFFGWASS